MSRTSSLLLSLALVLGGAGAAAAETIVWTDFQNTAQIGSTLNKISGGTAWNADAISTQTVGAGIDATLTFSLPSVLPSNNAHMIGFNTSNDSAHHTDLDHALYVHLISGDYNLSAWENGGLVGNLLATPTGGEEIRMERVSGVVSYYVDDSLIFTSPTASTGEIFVDTSLVFQTDSFVYEGNFQSVPEPSTLLCGLLALFGFGLTRRP